MTRTACGSDAGQSACASGESCLWINGSGSGYSGNSAGYFCATVCDAKTPCASGQACKAAAASSCMTCQDLLGICQ
jgi:hypothetical protein